MGSCRSIGRQPEPRLTIITKAGTAPAAEATVAVPDMHCTTQRPMRYRASDYSVEVADATPNLKQGNHYQERLRRSVSGETRTGMLGQPGPGMFTTGYRRGHRSLRRSAFPQAQLTDVVVRVGDGFG